MTGPVGPVRAALRAARARVGAELARRTRAAAWAAGFGRVPVIHQMTASDCGAACLTMILVHYRRDVTLGEVRDRYGVGRDGMNALGIARAARAAGLRARGLAVPADALSRISFPAVAHWRGRHFVVVERAGANGAWIVDPGAGRRNVGRAELAAAYGGVLIAFSEGVPGGDRVRGRRPKRYTLAAHLKRIVGVPGAPRVLGLVIAASAALQALGVAVAGFTKFVVDDVVGARQADVLSVVGAGMFVLVGTRVLVALARGVLVTRLTHRLDAKLTADFVRHLFRLPYGFFRQRTDGDVLSRVAAHAGMREALTAQLMSVALDIPLALTFLALLTVVSPPLAAVAVGSFVPQLALIALSARPTREATDRTLGARAEEQGCVVEMVKGVAAIKASGAERAVLERWRGLHAAQLDAAARGAALTARVEAVLGGARAATPLAALWVGAYEVLAGHVELGTMLAANALVISVLTPLTALSHQLQYAQLLRAHAARVADVLDSRPEQADRVVRAAAPLAGGVEFSHVTAGYEGGPPVLRDVSFRARAGEKLGIVGATGSGKSTLVKVLTGLVEPKLGEVRLDGVPLTTLAYDSVRSQFGVVLQEPVLFGGSLRENLTFNAPAATDDDVAVAVAAVGLRDDVAAMPLGYDTAIGDGGAALSGGQRQRVALARALLSRPRLLILDEATSHLDAATERHVMAALATLRCTRIVVAHRASTVADADWIVVLRDGRVVAEGKPADLLTPQGEYASLVGHLETRAPSGAGVPPTELADRARVGAAYT